MTHDLTATDAARILVVDDNDDNRYTLTLYLDLEGYRNVEVAHDGEQAITALKNGAFDLVLLDVMMPKVDGYQVLQWLKAEDRLHNVPVIMISALNELASVVRCIELGAVDYLSKPFDPVLLRARIGASLEKKRLRDEVHMHLARLETELDAARQLQMAMVPSAFPDPTADMPVEIFGAMEPAREVGGDLYDFFWREDGTLSFLVGDVSGKGMPAALFMARTKSLIRFAAELMRGQNGGAANPAEIISRVNRELCHDNSNLMFVTLFFAILAPRSGHLEFCNAGHNPPYRLSQQGIAPVEGAKGIILGVEPEAAYANGTLTLAPGEGIYLFTDGVTEAADAHGGMFSETRLETVLRENGDRASAEIVSAVTQSVHSFAGNALPSDDITMLAVRRLDPAMLKGR